MEELHCLTVKEIMEMKFDRFERVRFWKFNKREMTLDLKVKGCPGYWIDLDRCTSSAAVLDWIAQIAGKPWATAEIIGDLVLALNACLSLQANYCSFGVERGNKSVSEIRKIVRGNTK